jgi:DNA topoisomerase-1
LLPYKKEIDKKYQFLLEAPIKDSEGRDTVIRYSRKTKEQYVRSEKDGKPTGWSAYYSKGIWSVAEKSGG